MKTLAVKLLTGLTGSDGSFSPGDKVDLPINEALARIDNDEAVPVNKKLYQQALDAKQNADREADEFKARMNANLRKNELQNELKELYVQVALKTAEIEGVVLSDEEVDQFVETALTGEKFTDK